MHRFLINIPDDKWEKVREMAFKNKISISKLILEAIMEKIEKNSAPELLEILKRMVEDHEDGGPIGVRTMVLAKEAIAKAEGGSK